MKILSFLFFGLLTAEGHSMLPFAQMQRAKTADASPVLLEVYYETLCPDSIAFIVNQFYPVLGQINDIINASLVPYGKATVGRDMEEESLHANLLGC